MASAMELAKELASIREQIKELKFQEDEIVQTLAEEMDSDALIVDGVGVFERKMSMPRKAWDSDALRFDLLRKLPTIPRLMRPATGEIESDAETYGRVLSQCARMDWRVTALKVYDIDPDEYCEKSPGHFTIQISHTTPQKKSS